MFDDKNCFSFVLYVLLIIYRIFYFNQIYS